MTRITAQALEIASRALIEARPSSLGIEVSTPVVYPNGDCVTSIVTESAGGFTVHDAGLAAMQISADGGSMSKDAVARFRTACARYDCEFSAGRVWKQCDDGALVVAIMLVANASRAVADFVFEGKRHIEGNFRYVVAEKMRQLVGRRLRENEAYKGQSGRLYRVAGVVLDAAEAKPVAFVAALASRSSVPAHFKEFYDLHAALPTILKESVYDDNGDLRPDEDGWVLRQVGELIPFSNISAKWSKMLQRENRNP